MGGRPVEVGDHALITRHLRTSAYQWNGTRWVSLKDQELQIKDDDVDITNLADLLTKLLTGKKRWDICWTFMW